MKESAARPAHFVRLADRYAVPFTLVAYHCRCCLVCFKKSDTFCGSLSCCFAVSLILSAPIALVAGMGRSSRHGVVIKSGTMVEKLASAKRLRLIKQARLRKDNFLLIKSNQSMLE